MSIGSSSIQKSIGASRVLTFEFKKHRKAPVRKRFQAEIDVSPFRGNEKLLESVDSTDKIKPAFPPLWVDTYDKIIEDFSKMQETMNSLETLQQNRISSPFATKIKEIDSKINMTSESISHMIRLIDSQIKDLKTHEGNSEDKLIRKNIITSLSEKLREFSMRFKKKQEIYLSKANLYKHNDDFFDSGEVEISLDEESNELEIAAKYRNESINSLVENIIDLSDIFKELNTLVVNQGSILDRIDFNIQQALDNTKKANVQLIKAEKHQKCTRAAGCIALLAGIILLLLSVLALKVII